MHSTRRPRPCAVPEARIDRSSLSLNLSRYAYNRVSLIFRKDWLTLFRVIDCRGILTPNTVSSGTGLRIPSGHRSAAHAHLLSVVGAGRARDDRATT